MCVCVYVFGFIGRPLVSFFRIFPKVDKVDLARSSQNRGLRSQMYTFWLKKEQKISNSKSERTASSSFFCEQSSYFSYPL